MKEQFKKKLNIGLTLAVMLAMLITMVVIKRDATAPVVAVTGVINGTEYTLGSVPAAGCSTTDGTSGVATAATLSTTGGPVGSITATCSGALDYAGNAGSASVTYSVIYDFDGFFRPVEMDMLNKVKAGSAVPIKFSLNGYQGLDIFNTGFPKSVGIVCGNAQVDPVETTIVAANSGLQYDGEAGQYIYVWKTEKAWAGTCREFRLGLKDGSVLTAQFTFTK
jgi:hypothetical protein